MNRYTAFLTHVDTRQLPRQMPPYITKKHYHFGKKVVDVGFVRQPDILFQPVTFRLEHLSLVETTVKQFHFQDHIQEINAL